MLRISTAFSREAIRISVTPACTVLPGNPVDKPRIMQMTRCPTSENHDGSFGSSPSPAPSSPSPPAPSPLCRDVDPHSYEKKKKRKKNSRNCQVHTSRAASIIAARRWLVTCLFSSEAQIHGNYRSLLANIHRHERTPRT